MVPEQAPTIQAAVDSSVSGDVVVIASGVYDDCTHLNGNNVAHIAILKSGVSLRGTTGNPADVILDAGRLGRCLELRNASGDISIEGLTLRRGLASAPFGSGGGVFVYSSEPVFRQCVFDSCHAEFAGGGIAASHGAVTVEDCVFVACGTDNIGAAIRATNSPVSVTGSTIHGATGAAIHYAGDTLTLANTIIAFGDAEAIYRNSTSDSPPTLSCCDLFGNDEDWSDYFVDQNGQDGNLSVDPLFCNPLFGDLHLYAVSPCAPDANTECGLIGALPVNCGQGAATWVVAADGSGDFPTIQSAINAAADGDTVALADGTFTGVGNRDLDFLGKAITLMGQSGDPELATIDCQGSVGDPHRGFHFHNDESGFAVLRDVTIVNADVAGDGAAVLCESSPIIENCVFIHNHAARGAAIFCDGGSPLIADCRFIENEGREQAGGIAFLGSEARVEGSLFLRNWGYQGSAFFLPDSSAVVVSECTLVDNASSLDKACAEVEGNSSLSLVRTIISGGNRRAVRCYDTASVAVNGCNLYDNAEGDYSDCIAGLQGQFGNISADPLYCDPVVDEYTIRADSPCADTNSPQRLLIGAFEVGCSAPVVFVDVSMSLPQVNARSGGAAWLDIDGDGHRDCFVANDGSANEVLLGDGDGAFSQLDDAFAGHVGPCLTGSWADYDNDGDCDLYLGIDNEPNLLGVNDAGSFNPADMPVLANMGPAAGTAWADYNNDGRLDLYLAAGDSTSGLWRNNGDDSFTDLTEYPLSDLREVVGASWCDYDNDGDRDLYVVRDGERNKLFRNTGLFSDETVAPLDDEGSGRGAAWGDYDNDGWLDLYLSNRDGGNRLVRNKGAGLFENQTTGALIDNGPGSSGIWGDWDNDGDLDLFLANCGTADRLLRNDGDGAFIDIGAEIFAAADSSTGAAWSDYDEDGDLDLLVADQFGATRLYRNDSGDSRHWLELDLSGYDGQAGAPGARVRIVTADTLRQIREVGAGGGWLSQDDHRVHFGLGAATVVDTLVVIWPGGQMRVETAVDADQVLFWERPQAISAADGVTTPAVCLAPCYPNPFNPATVIRFELAAAGDVQLKVYDLAGRLVDTLVDEPRPAGRHTELWRGRDRADRQVAAGVYFVRLVTGDRTLTRAVTLLK